MKGILLGALLLIGLDVILQAPAARVIGALVPVSNALNRWMDPTVPLLSGPSSPPPSSPKRPPSGAQRRTPPPPTANQRP